MSTRKIKTTVNNFIHCGDEYLFLLRNPDKRVDPNRLNSIGGHVEPGENFLEANIRETAEETGIIIQPNENQLVGIVRLEGGYDEDYVICFFKTEVHSKKIPIGSNTPDGKLMWIHKDKVLKSKYELVDDLYSSFDMIVNNKNQIFFQCIQLNEKQKVNTHSTLILKVKQS